MSKKTRKNNNSQNTNTIIRYNNKHNNAKKATQIKCRMKTCRAKKYQSLFGSVGGSIRSNRQLYY